MQGVNYSWKIHTFVLSMIFYIQLSSIKQFWLWKIPGFIWHMITENIFQYFSVHFHHFQSFHHFSGKSPLVKTFIALMTFLFQLKTVWINNSQRSVWIVEYRWKPMYAWSRPTWPIQKNPKTHHSSGCWTIYSSKLQFHSVSTVPQIYPNILILEKMNIEHWTLNIEYRIYKCMYNNW